MLAHVTPRAGVRVGKKVNSRKTEVLIKTTRVIVPGHMSVVKRCLFSNLFKYLIFLGTLKM